MNSVRPFIPKDDFRLPDYYGMRVRYIDGSVDEFEAVYHKLGEKVLEICTVEDMWEWVSMVNVKRISFDKSFSKMVALKKDSEKKKEPPNA